MNDLCCGSIVHSRCKKGSSPTHWMPVLADQWVVPSWIYSYHCVAPQCSFLEPLTQSLCLKWLLTFLVISSIKRLKRNAKWSAHFCSSCSYVHVCAQGPHRLMIRSCSPSVLNSPSTRSLHSPQLSSFPTLSLLRLLWDGRHTNCCDQHYGHTLLSLLNKLVAFYWAARHGGESVLALLLYWHLKKINCAQGGFQLVNSYYNSASFMYN